MTLGSLPSDVRVRPPGPASKELARRLAAVESRNITYVADDWPVFWEEAVGSNVRDADGNVYVDLTAAFGVALLGHAHPAIVSAVAEQAGRLMHGMGDVHPASLKVDLLERLRSSTPRGEGVAVLASTGSEAVEVALKTAQIATGRPGVLAFEGGYHGLTLGALAATARPAFREPFRPRVYEGVAFAPFPSSAGAGATGADASLTRVRELLRKGAPNGDEIGAVIVEPVQGRAGARVPPAGYMAELSLIARDAGVLVIADEVLTGLGRCGATLASARVGLEPDLVCLGKALGGGMPVSACVGRPDVMEAWPRSTGEAIHTSTFLGHPLACASALAFFEVMDLESVPERAESLGIRLLRILRERLGDARGVAEVRGLGLLIGIELREPSGSGRAVGAASRVATAALQRGVLLLPAGDHGQVVELTPPVSLTHAQVDDAVEVIAHAITSVT